VGLSSVGTPVLWASFIGFVVVMLVLDLSVFHRKAHAVQLREALLFSSLWVGLARLFAVGVYFWFGPRSALEFLTGYLIEEALSVDNLFVILVLFSYFAVPPAVQHRVLFWGILGALVMRALFIVLGAALLNRFHWLIFVFGGFLVFTGAKLMFGDGGEVHPEKNLVIRLLRKVIPAVSNYRGAAFLVKENGRWLATPLLMVLVAVEATDIVFAVDSIPAIFAVTTDPFIVFTSNIFAVLGLRSLFFVLAGVMGRFHYLKLGLGLVLAFVGGKMLLADLVKVPIGLSLGVIALLLGGSIAASLLWPRPEHLASPDPVPPEPAPVPREGPVP
jgi:tellurite resistance protein TerC